MPNRILKESIRTSKSINAMSDFQFRLWAYLITYVDDFGRGSAEPDILKGFVFPRRKCVTEATIKSALLDLANLGLVILYEVDGESYLSLRNWEKHQNRRATSSKYPEPPEIDVCEQMQADASGCMQMQTDAPVTRYSILDTRYSNNDNVCADADESFESFWSVYPRKVRKQDALKAWRSAKLAKIADKIIADVKKRCETEWKGAEMQYIPHPTTYLHQKRWEDETAPTERIERQPRPTKDNPALNYAQRDYKEEDFGDDFFFDAVKAYGSTN